MLEFILLLFAIEPPKRRSHDKTTTEPT